MPDLPDQFSEPFEIEPEELLDGSPAPPKRRVWLMHRSWQSWLPGLVALVEGLALLGFFWLAPWFSWRLSSLIYVFDLHNTPALLRYRLTLLAEHPASGWAASQGISLDDLHLNPMVPLWLIPLAAGLLLVLAGCSLWRRLSARHSLNALLALSAVCLLVELSFYLQARTFQDLLVNQTIFSIFWGFWAALAVTAAGMAVGLMQRRLTRLRARA
jgi:hypothetical protein